MDDEIKSQEGEEEAKLPADSTGPSAVSSGPNGSPQADSAPSTSSGQAGSLPAANAGELEAKLEKCEKERDEYLNGWQRAKADLLNYKRDEMERMAKTAAYAAEDVFREMISVLDSFDLGLVSLEKKGAADKGLYMIRAQVEDILAKRGLSRIAVEVGKPCDHHFVESVAEVESELPAGAVVAEIEPGYMLNGKVLRPARVTVAKGRGAS